MLLSALAFIVVIGVLVVIHEAGHFDGIRPRGVSQDRWLELERSHAATAHVAQPFHGMEARRRAPL